MTDMNTTNTGVSEFVTISKKEYDDLLDKENWLECLELAGVDHWEGYDYARELYQGED